MYGDFPPFFFKRLNSKGEYEDRESIDSRTEDVDYKLEHNCIGNGKVVLPPEDPLALSETFQQLSKADLETISNLVKQNNV